jgi:V8-like Glu-specific endopeptidase
MKKFLIVVTMLVFSLATVFAGNGELVKRKVPLVEELGMMKSPGQFDAVDYARQMREKFDWLKAEAAALTDRSIFSIQVSPDDLDGIENYQCETCGDVGARKSKLRVGVTKPFGAYVSMATHGEMQKTPDGGFVWTAAFESAGAAALRLHLTGLSLPEGVQVYVYNEMGEAFGPYMGRGPNKNGDLWTNATSGSIVYLQVHAGPGVSVDTIRFKVTELGHLGSKFLIPFFRTPDRDYESLSSAQVHCSYNASCVEDGACYGTSDFPGYNDVKYGVAHILFYSAPYWYICSGGLLNNTSQDGTPYFLTANHCISTSSEANSLETYFQFFNPYCHAPCVSRGTVDTVGATILRHGSSSDFSFMLLNQSPPGGSVFLGWTTQAVANSNGTNLYRLSHPKGAPQAYSQHDVDTNKPTCGSWPRGAWIYSQDITGATEGGSSGSPVCISTGQVVGQLSGACGYDPGNPCASSLNATVDGAFANYYRRIRRWLNR